MLFSTPDVMLIELHIDEEGIFGSDFESTDEETAQAEADAEEKGVDVEEQRARKVCIVCSSYIMHFPNMLHCLDRQPGPAQNAHPQLRKLAIHMPTQKRPLLLLHSFRKFLTA